MSGIQPGVVAFNPTPGWDPRPTPYHQWDPSVRGFVLRPGALDAARADRAGAVNRLCVEHQERPVSYDGSVFDADAAARENIAGVVARIGRGDGLTGGWIGWRTFDNSMVWASASAEDVFGHLRGVSLLIEDRKQALLAAAWAHKAALARLESVEAILAYDITAGWPT